jgi:aflatoxin B1 aldehyde reductase
MYTVRTPWSTPLTVATI